MSYDPHETELVLLLASAGRCSLDSSKGSNWVQEGGGLPAYICKIAKEIKKSGRSTSTAIAMAISQVKKWAAGGEDVKPDTRAKAAKAVAQWEALKAKSKGKKAVRASNTLADGTEAAYLFFSSTGDFNTDLVRQAWERRERQARRSMEQAGDPMEAVPFTWIRELWTSHLIVENESTRTFAKVPYSVTNGAVYFGEPVAIEQVWEEVEDVDLDEDEIALIATLSAPVGSPLGKILSLTQKG